MKQTIIIAINCFIIIVNFCNCFDNTLTEIFQFRRDLETSNGEKITKSCGVDKSISDRVSKQSGSGKEQLGL